MHTRPKGKSDCTTEDQRLHYIQDAVAKHTGGVNLFELTSKQIYN